MRSMSAKISSVVQCRDGRLLVARRDGLAFYDWETRSDELFLPGNDAFDPGTIPNEGRCDAAGRYWFGTMATTGESPVGSLFCLRNDLSVNCVLRNICIPNSIGWSPDATKMYFADSASNSISVFDFNLRRGEIGNRREFVRLSNSQHLPDGSAIDTLGNVWNSTWGAGAVACYSPTGKLVRTIELPVSRPTSCAFGGVDGRTLFVTSAKAGLSEEQRGREPLAGNLFSVRMPRKGCIDNEFQRC